MLFRSANVGPLLHGDDPQLVLLVDPDQEGFFLVVENASSGRPVSVQTAGLEESVAFLEQKVVGDELVLVFLGHCGESVVSSSEFAGELFARTGHELFDLVSLIFGDARTKWEVGEVPADSDSG